MPHNNTEILAATAAATATLAGKRKEPCLRRACWRAEYYNKRFTTRYIFGWVAWNSEADAMQFYPDPTEQRAFKNLETPPQLPLKGARVVAA